MCLSSRKLALPCLRRFFIDGRDTPAGRLVSTAPDQFHNSPATPPIAHPVFWSPDAPVNLEKTSTMKSEKRNALGKSKMSGLGLACAAGFLGLLLSSAGSKAQLPTWIDRQPVFIPRSPSNTRIKPSEPAPRVQPTEATPATPGTAVSPTGIEAAPGVPPSPLLGQKVRNNEISVAADFMIGEGDVTVPIGYSLKESVPGSEVEVRAASADRSSIYYGGTISYSYKRAWFIDLSTARGSSSGNVDFEALPFSSDPDFKTKFKIDDQWYQAYVRYTFPALRGKPFSAYLRAGASYVMADLEVEAIGGPPPRYSQEDETRDILGNLGFGVTYMLYTTRKIRLGISESAIKKAPSG
jgi:hypothetical protein